MSEGVIVFILKSAPIVLWRQLLSQINKYEVVAKVVPLCNFELL